VEVSQAYRSFKNRDLNISIPKSAEGFC